eukprot:TRINITY_DN4219_c0_g1_i4.p1 TRINITY_DN4219_c0_g1~~TRINITY_DN4219_c0_g1_i4.p1  ORF type:complete len:356 (-),score=35.88 TRINITY_DN4219_c0_g1_i4:163-1230(-)
MVDYSGVTLHCTTSVMVIVLKCISFAWSYSDGDPNNRKDLTPEQERVKIEKLPSLLYFYSYNFNFSTAIVNPVFAYKDFDDFVYLRGSYKDIPPCGKRVTILLLQALHNLVMFLLTRSICPISFMTTKDFEDWSIPRQWVYIAVAAYFLRTKYYLVWKLAQASITLAGLAYDGNDENGNPKWDRINTAQTRVELTENMPDRVSLWNMSVQHYFKQHVYLRIAPYEKAKGRPGLQQLATFLTFTQSAIWHGVHPAYYIFFIQISLYVETSRFFYRNRDIFHFFTHKIFFPFRFFAVHLLFAYPSIQFCLLSTNHVMQYWKATRYSVLSFEIAVITFGIILSRLRKSKAKVERAKVE